MSYEVNAIFHEIEKDEAKYIKFWEDICNIETVSNDKEALDGLVDFVQEFALAEGFTVKRTPFEKCGDFLTIDMNEGAEKGYIFLAHMDTVHVKGKFGYPPVKIEGNKMIGPGVIDCKGGIAVALLVMKSLKTLGYEKHLRLMLTSDEEVSNCLGGEKEIDFIVNTAAGFKGAFNCEVARDGEVVVSRKGILRVRIHITGKPSHSGIDYFAGVSAVREAAYKLIELETQSKEGATTYNCGIIQGGDIINIVPAKCTMSVDVRVNSVEDMDAAYEVIKKVTEKSFVEGSKAELEIISKRMPMMRTKETNELFEKLREVSLANGLGDLIPIESGGGSDSAYTQLAGVPSVCAVGACGDYCHTVNEYAEIDSLVKRAKLLAAITIWR